MPRSIAIDASTNRVYWANSSSPAITCVNGSEGGSVFTDGLETDNLQGIAIDPIAQRVFWGAPENDTLGFASITEGGPLGLLDTTGATRDSPAWPVLLYVPRNTAAPTVTAFRSPTPRILRKPKPGRPLVPLVASHTATLSCSQGSWAGDLLESFLYRAPQRISLQWLRNERPIPGATTSSLVATEVGDYICRATASNAAGSTRPGQRLGQHLRQPQARQGGAQRREGDREDSGRDLRHRRRRAVRQGGETDAS